MGYQIRMATIDDLPQTVEIFNQAIPLGVNDDTAPLEVVDRQEWFQQFDDTHPLWVMVNDQQIIAWCGLEYFYPHPAYVHSAEIAVYVRSEFQGQHLGRTLLQFVDQQITKQLAIKTVIAYIYAENTPSQHLFEACGYSQWGHLPKISHIKGQFRDLLVFGKNF
ncbi:MAG: N-acetyltransferase family protein [Lactobacillus sp.]|nr:N-acetyltransferase family protein [Lactobacillus sp.]